MGLETAIDQRSAGCLVLFHVHIHSGTREFSYEVARRLINVEESEYSLGTDEEPYEVACQGRFSFPEIIAVEGDVVRRLRLLKGVLKFDAASFFVTPNFADTYRPFVLQLHEGPGKRSLLDFRGAAVVRAGGARSAAPIHASPGAHAPNRGN